MDIMCQNLMKLLIKVINIIKNVKFQIDKLIRKMIMNIKTYMMLKVGE